MPSHPGLSWKIHVRKISRNVFFFQENPSDSGRFVKVKVKKAPALLVEEVFISLVFYIIPGLKIFGKSLENTLGGVPFLKNCSELLKIHLYLKTTPSQTWIYGKCFSFFNFKRPWSILIFLVIPSSASFYVFYISP